ncbi:hypothetical protein NL676_009423 [Syzygium grande]|nr:hypothetical protein NL676_009423 [Syzygium grande]
MLNFIASFLSPPSLQKNSFQVFHQHLSVLQLFFPPESLSLSLTRKYSLTHLKPPPLPPPPPPPPSPTSSAPPLPFRLRHWPLELFFLFYSSPFPISGSVTSPTILKRKRLVWLDIPVAVLSFGGSTDATDGREEYCDGGQRKLTAGLAGLAGFSGFAGNLCLASLGLVAASVAASMSLKGMTRTWLGWEEQ